MALYMKRLGDVDGETIGELKIPIGVANDASLGQEAERFAPRVMVARSIFTGV